MATATTAPSPRRLGLPLRTLSDERLARLAARGEQDALAAIFERHHQALYRYCRALLGSAQDAEDALQNAMARVVRALPGETRELALKPWLYRIVHNEAMRIAGRRRPQAALEEAQEVAAPSDTEHREARERLTELLADLGELSERQRGALVLRELEDASFAHIASVFGGSEAAAKQTVYEARVCLADFARGRAMGCDEVTRALSDGDRRRLRGRPVRGHLRACEECRAFEAALHRRPQELRALAPPLAVPAAAALLGKLLGGGGGGGAGGLGASAAAGGTVASFALPSFALKGLATIAVAAGAAGGLGEVVPGLPGVGGGPAAITEDEPGARAGDGDGDQDERRSETLPRRGDRDAAAGAARDERGTSAGARGDDATRAESGERPGGASAADRSSRRAPESDAPARSREGGSGASGRGRGGARPGPAGDPPRSSAPSPPAGRGRAPSPRSAAPEGSAPSTTPAPLPPAPSAPGIGDLTSPLPETPRAGTERGSVPRP